MRIFVAGDFKNPVLLDTTKATALIVSTDDGKPNVVFKLLENGKGWLRLTEGEDKNFAEEVKKLGLT